MIFRNLWICRPSGHRRRARLELRHRRGRDVAFDLLRRDGFEEDLLGDVGEVAQGESGRDIGFACPVPEVAGAVASLVGDDCVLDHHFLHVTFPPRFFEGTNRRQTSQHTHQDSTIDPRQAFDMQIMYFPHEVTRPMGGTRYLPGSHLRIVSEAAIARYQNIRGQQHVVCPAGTVLFTHMGIWHGGGVNLSDRLRYMFKIRLCPTRRQVRLWDDSDLGDDHFEQRPIFWRGGSTESDPVQHRLTRGEPWFEADSGRLEYINRIRFWRYLLGDDTFDADYWVTRVENEHL
mgnify:CR=1 FL=1